MLVVVWFSDPEYRVKNIQFLSKHSGEALLVCTTGKILLQ